MPFRIDADMERSRLRSGAYASPPGVPYGAFSCQGPKGATLIILASDGHDDSISSELRGWEHVSVSTSHRTPNWAEMCWVKDRFWEPEDVVVQYHPRRSQYISLHDFTLHMWRHRTLDFPTPPPILVGPGK